MTTSPYSRSVELFDTLMQAPRSASHDTPASLIQAANIPSTTGYRHVAALEAEGFLRRDPTGVYLRGAGRYYEPGLTVLDLAKCRPLHNPFSCACDKPHSTPRFWQLSGILICISAPIRLAEKPAGWSCSPSMALKPSLI